jgi:hypothetical protein
MTRENPCSLDEYDAIALTRTFEALGSGLREQAVRDLFALGCYVHAIGSPEGRDAGSNACLAAMDALRPSSLGLHRKILDNLTGNEEWLARLLSPQYEIMKLFFARSG